MKYKICPKCQNHCKISLSQCPSCKRSIISVPITDDDVVSQSQAQPSQPVQEITSEAVRICDYCQTKNKPNARKCEKCGEDISDIKPTAATISAPIPVTISTSASSGFATAINTSLTANYYMASIDGKFRFDIQNPVHILGRNNEFNDYLGLKPFVSGTHAKITMNENLIYITDMGSTNGTFINNTRAKVNVPVLLNNNDEIGLGGNSSGGYTEKAAYLRIFKVAH